MIGKHHSRPAALGRRLPPAVPAVLHAVVEGGRREPLRSWYAAVGVTMVVFLVVTSIGVISGRSAHGGYPIMVQPQGPALPVPPFGGESPFDPPPPPGTSAPTPGKPTPGKPTPGQPTPGHPTRRAPDGVSPAGYDRDREDAAAPEPRFTPPTTGPAAPRPAPTRTTNRPTPPKTSSPRPPKPSPPKPSPPKPSPPKPSPPKPSPAGSVTARYIVYSSWDEGFTTGIELANNTGQTQSWKLKLIHERSDGVRVKELWNADLKQGGATTNVFVGGDLAPGGTLHFGFNASKTVRGKVRPTSCTINGKRCSFG